MGGLPYGDIIVIAAIAAFIILRYRAMLGEKSGRDTDPTPAVRPLQEYERVIQLPERAPKPVTEKDYGDLSPTFAKMRAIDKQFTVEEFLEGARGAYEMVIDAFNGDDRDTLKMLLSKEIYQQFEDTLDAQKEEGKKQHTTLVAITESKITDATLTGAKAQLTVYFVSEQIILTRNGEGEVIEGDASYQQAIDDHWVFERTLSSADPSWKVIDT
jgi:predicted lipid-binding transport protein (Tim44 family)